MVIRVNCLKQLPQLMFWKGRKRVSYFCRSIVENTMVLYGSHQDVHTIVS